MILFVDRLSLDFIIENLVCCLYPLGATSQLMQETCGHTIAKHIWSQISLWNGSECLPLQDENAMPKTFGANDKFRICWPLAVIQIPKAFEAKSHYFQFNCFA